MAEGILIEFENWWKWAPLHHAMAVSNIQLRDQDQALIFLADPGDN